MKLKKVLKTQKTDQVLWGQLISIIETQEKEQEQTPRKKGKVLYRPHRGSLAYSMLETQEFPDLKSMFKFVADDELFNITERDIWLKYYGYDTCANWDTYVVCYQENDREYPRVMGYCTFI